MKYRLVIFVTTICLSIASFASDKNFAKSIKDAETYYVAKEYNKAIDEYNMILNDGFVSSEIYFNLGNCYYSNQDWGNAIVSYLMAQKLDPSNKMIDENLSFLLSKVDDKNKTELEGKEINVSPEEPGFFQYIYDSVVIGVGSDTWAVVAIVTFIIAIVGLVIYFLLRNVLYKKIGFFGALVCLFTSIVVNIFAFVAQSEYYSCDRAVVVEYSVKLKSEAKDSSSEVSTPLHSGTVMEVMDSYVDINDDKWLKLRLNSEISGWVKESVVKIV